MPYFLLLVGYPSETTVEDEVALVVDSYAACTRCTATIVLLGLAVATLALA